jgi:hypothetical protein
VATSFRVCGNRGFVCSGPKHCDRPVDILGNHIHPRSRQENEPFRGKPPYSVTKGFCRRPRRSGVRTQGRWPGGVRPASPVHLPSAIWGSAIFDNLNLPSPRAFSRSF